MCHRAEDQHVLRGYWAVRQSCALAIGAFLASVAPASASMIHVAFDGTGTATVTGPNVWNIQSGQTANISGNFDIDSSSVTSESFSPNTTSYNFNGYSAHATFHGAPTVSFSFGTDVGVDSLSDFNLWGPGTLDESLAFNLDARSAEGDEFLSASIERAPGKNQDFLHGLNWYQPISLTGLSSADWRTFGRLLAVDKSGASESDLSIDFQFQDFAMSSPVAQQVPEPSGLALLVAPLLALLYRKARASTAQEA